ncbi:hypothetical protein BJ742DRAFT_851377 [Cladochytrium replicatum]|nr:hypothetical protein BJ742DRAFT_851377 [Cladochytrium replicatum]
MRRGCAERDLEEVGRGVLELGGAAAKLRSMIEWKGSPISLHCASFVTTLSRFQILRMDKDIRKDGSHRRRLRMESGSWQGSVCSISPVSFLDLFAGRILRTLGASVLQCSSLNLPTDPAADVDKSFGKRSTFVDLDNPEDQCAPVPWCMPYGSLKDGEADSEIVKWSHHRGFDSLTQLATGIVHDGGRWNEGLTGPKANLAKIVPRNHAITVLASALGVLVRGVTETTLTDLEHGACSFNCPDLHV